MVGVFSMNHKELYDPCTDGVPETYTTRGTNLVKKVEYSRTDRRDERNSNISIQCTSKTQKQR